nr:MAG TPA: hypothetical protein [Caudoviricetes sp.]
MFISKKAPSKVPLQTLPNYILCSSLSRIRILLYITI